MGKKRIAALLLVFCLSAGCGPVERQTETERAGLENIAGNSKESIYFNSYNMIAAAPDGYYTLQIAHGDGGDGSYLTYISKDSGEETYLCSKPDCSHREDSVFHPMLHSCDAYVECAMHSSIRWHNGFIYLLEYDRSTYDVTLSRISGDGSVHEKLVKIGQAPNYGSYYKYVFADEDTVYYTYDDPETALEEERTVSLYKIDLKTKEITEVYSFTGRNASVSFSLMTLNRSLFFRQVTVEEGGVYKEYLMRYDMDTGKTEAVLEEAITSYTLVGDGKLVYAVPKDGLYLYDMETGEKEKIRACDEETMYVSLAWDGTYLYLENLENRIFYNKTTERKVLVCTLEGETVNEIGASADYVELTDGEYMLMRMFVQGEGVFWSYIKSSDITNPNVEWTVLRPEREEKL